MAEGRVMVRIRGKIGEWPVDLTIEMDAQDWAHLGRSISLESEEKVPAASAVAASSDDKQWQTTLELLRRAGSIEGPQLLNQLAALAGGEKAAKRLLVRLRHSAQVRVETGVDAPLYHWLG